MFVEGCNQRTVHTQAVTLLRIIVAIQKLLLLHVSATRRPAGAATVLHITGSRWALISHCRAPREQHPDGMNDAGNPPLQPNAEVQMRRGVPPAVLFESMGGQHIAPLPTSLLSTRAWRRCREAAKQPEAAVAAAGAVAQHQQVK